MIKTFEHIENNEVVGSLVFYTIILPSRYLGVIEEVFVKKEYREKGIATKLMNEALDYAKELNLDCVELTTNKNIRYVLDFYKKLGFYDRDNISLRFPINKFHNDGKIH
ncbi:GNAT family N-acetyltransferase [Methanoculleus sp.]|jgi:ribosomal protein S18 acetylase RimI-like enzyme|uniref:GNAT family N-acetyltransferase n=1 Tax=Methanoculleus sp. TaxID=90427 RepID=UPI002600255C|nr:GNAT family N-acetyltransferase [Methanoculleus sp.]MCK9319849.1 GNAT family N-acetyltransferase [Methanoculleus sp.]